MGTDRGRLRAGLGHVHPTRSQASPTSAPPPGTALPSTWSASSTWSTARTTACRSTTPAASCTSAWTPPADSWTATTPTTTPQQRSPPKGSAQSAGQPRQHQRPDDDADADRAEQQPKGRAARPSVAGQYHQQRAGRPGRQGGEQLDQREQPQQPETASSRILSPTRPRHGPALGRHKPSTANTATAACTPSTGGRRTRKTSRS